MSSAAVAVLLIARQIAIPAITVRAAGIVNILRMAEQANQMLDAAQTDLSHMHNVFLLMVTAAFSCSHAPEESPVSLPSSVRPDGFAAESLTA